ncbi:MAG: OmpA family protein [Gammaproteobacteria bacterium]|nr:OmpA family protein [Gammaproteobacteria bacterium]MDH5629563.1 OmpA family protein [Gammaproteobacteria bacterium]
MNRFVWFVISNLIFIPPAYASFKVFEAPIDESTWNFQGNPLSCQLSHFIPYYGEAKFEKVSGNTTKVDFQLEYKRHRPTASKNAVIRSVSPPWHVNQQMRELGKVELQKGSQIIKAQELGSWILLNELEQGHFPTFFYQDFNDKEDQISIALSSVGFRDKYDDFLDCLANLVPYNLKDLQNMTLNFDFDKYIIRTSYRSKLDALAAYIKYDPSIQVVLINGYTDSKGSRYYNQLLAEKRIQSVMDKLRLDGVDESRFKLMAYGETDPVASNRTAEGRAKNRRVVINLK